jgi:hypothetical protein
LPIIAAARRTGSGGEASDVIGETSGVVDAMGMEAAFRNVWWGPMSRARFSRRTP